MIFMNNKLAVCQFFFLFHITADFSSYAVCFLILKMRDVRLNLSIYLFLLSCKL